MLCVCPIAASLHPYHSQQFPRPPRQSKVITEFAKEEDRILREKMEAKRRYEEEQRRRLEERNAAEKAGTSTSGAFFSSEASPSRSVASREPMNQQVRDFHCFYW